MVFLEATDDSKIDVNTHQFVARIVAQSMLVGTYLRDQVDQLTWRKKTELFLRHFSVFSPSGGREFPGGLYRPNWWELEQSPWVLARKRFSISGKVPIRLVFSAGSATRSNIK